MKGTVLVCLGQLVKEKFGESKWREVTEHAGLGPNYIVLAGADVVDETAFALIGSVCSVLKLSQQQAFDAFGEYWMCDYGPRVYAAYYEGIRTTKEFLTRLDALHLRVMKNVPNSQPPRFQYEWQGERRLVMTYQSPRNLIDLMISMAKGTAKYFKEDIRISKLSENKVQFDFA